MDMPKNATRIESLARFLEQLPQDRFDMRAFVYDKKSGTAVGRDVISSLIERDPSPHRCGTVGCIAGYAVLMFGAMDQIHRCARHSGWDREAEKLLGLTPFEGDLFFDYSIKTPVQAAHRLRELAR